MTFIFFRGVETTNQKMFERVSQLRTVFYRRTGANLSYWSTKRDVSTCFVGNVHLLPASQSNRWNDIFDMSNLLNMAHKLVSVKMLKIIFHDFLWSSCFLMLNFDQFRSGSVGFFHGFPRQVPRGPCGGEGEETHALARLMSCQIWGEVRLKMAHLFVG